MGPFRSSIAALIALSAATLCSAQGDIKLNVTYICNGEHIYVDSCNIRDLSDTAACMVEHPDHVNAGGIAAITSETRGSLKKRLPTCQQPTAKELAAEAAFKKKQDDIYAANVAKANPQPVANRAQPTSGNQQQQQVTPPKNAEERAMRRCVSSGRLPATCTGNSLLGAFGQMLGQVAPSLNKEPAPGPELAGVFQGPGNWRLDFIDGGVLVNCAFLSPNQESYTIDFKNNRPALTIDTRPKPLVLAVHTDGTITGHGPVTIDGVVATGSSGPDPNGRSGYTDKYGMSLSNSQAASSSEVYSNGERHYGPVTSAGQTTTNFAPRRATCPALNLSSKNAGPGIQTMQTDLLKSVFSDGDNGPPTPAGIRMHGIFAASTGFSAQFFPESVILGCGSDSARAYPYTVVADGTKSFVKVDAPDHPLTLTFAPNNSLDPGTGPYLVHGRMVVGTNDNDDFTFAPMEQTCNLAILTPSKTIPSGGGAAMMTAANTPTANPRATPDNNNGRLSTPAAPLGNATLSIVSGLPTQPGAANPLAGRPYVLLRDSYAQALAKAGVTVPPGASPYKYVATTCATTPRTPACQTMMTAINNDAISAVRADATGSGVLPGVPPGTYYLMISAAYNNQGLTWGQAVEIKSGQNSLTLNLRDAKPLN
jgi:hypothetical protein